MPSIVRPPARHDARSRLEPIARSDCSACLRRRLRASRPCVARRPRSALDCREHASRRSRDALDIAHAGAAVAAGYAGRADLCGMRDPARSGCSSCVLRFSTAMPSKPSPLVAGDGPRKDAGNERRMSARRLVPWERSSACGKAATGSPSALAIQAPSDAVSRADARSAREPNVERRNQEQPVAFRRAPPS